MAVAARMKSGTRPEAASSPGPVPAAAPARILVADDDHSIAELVRIYLAKQGFEVEVAHDGNEVSTRLREFDLVVLDIMMPGPNGLQVLRALRQHSDLPVILLTARTSDIDKIAGLQVGADDYVTKPFNPWELVARVEAVLRRGRRQTAETPLERVQVGGLVMELAARRAYVNGVAVDLTPKEFDLLATMARLPGVMLDRTKLLELVWGNAYFSSRTVDVHIVKLRACLAGANVRIETVWGSGYRLVEVHA
jgi:DNA-binding response OmpR family regulator